jgi:hypothetical protein
MRARAVAKMSVEKCYAERRIAAANAAMCSMIDGASDVSPELACLFPRIRIEFRQLEELLAALQVASAWPVVYASDQPYEDGVIGRVLCTARHGAEESQILVRAHVCAPLPSVCHLLWAVEHLGQWCDSVKSAVVLHEIDGMSQLVLCEMRPVLASMFRASVAFVRMTMLEYQVGSAACFAICFENMSDDELRTHEHRANGQRVQRVRRSYMSFRPRTAERFELAVLFSQRAGMRVFAHASDFVYVQTFLGFLWQLGREGAKIALMGRRAVNIDKWLGRHAPFADEVEAKIARCARVRAGGSAP